jgi:hypothetical protein
LRKSPDPWKKEHRNVRNNHVDPFQTGERQEVAARPGRAPSTPVWQAPEGLATVALLAVQAAGWLMVLASTFMIDHFELFGVKQVLARLSGRPLPPPVFRTPMLYKHVRHPIYLGFMLAFWATPSMTAGHLLFAVATTGYILIGIWFEERDLVQLFGQRYQDYRQRVGMLLPLKRNRAEPVSEVPVAKGGA